MIYGIAWHWHGVFCYGFLFRLSKKVTEYLCSDGFFFRQFSIFQLAIFDECMLNQLKGIVVLSSTLKVISPGSFFGELRDFYDCQIGTINA